MPPGNSGSCSTTRRRSGLSSASTATGGWAVVVGASSAVEEPSVPSASPCVVRRSVMVLSFDISSLTLSTTFSCLTDGLGRAGSGVAAIMSLRSRAGSRSRSCMSSNSALSSELSVVDAENSSATYNVDSATTSPSRNHTGRCGSRLAFDDFFISTFMYLLKNGTKCAADLQMKQNTQSMY